MAAIQRRTDKAGKTTFRVQVRLKGYPPQTASFERLTDARKWAASTESAIREGRHFKTAEAKRKTLADAIDRYKQSRTPYPRLAVVLALSTGARYNELLSLEWRQVDLKAGAIILERTKNGDRRRLPLKGLALELMKEHGKVRRLDTPLCFPGKSDPETGETKSVAIRKAFENALERAGSRTGCRLDADCPQARGGAGLKKRGTSTMHPGSTNRDENTPAPVRPCGAVDRRFPWADCCRSEGVAL